MDMNWPLQSECDSFYGNPRGNHGGANEGWVAANIVTAYPPAGWQFVASWDLSLKLKGIQCHRKAKDSLEAVLRDIWDMCGRDYSQIKQIRMHLLGGGYNFRLMRSGNQLSMHSWGCAVDFDPDENAMYDPTPAMDRRVIEIFEKHGWEWGGHWKNKDSMHFQAAHTRRDWPRLGEVGPALSKEQIVELQERLSTLGYKMVGVSDGKIGKNTKAAIGVFQSDNGLPQTEVFDERTRAALATARPRQVSELRANATASDLADHPVVQQVQSLGSKLVKGGVGIAALSGGSELTSPSSLLDGAQGALNQVDQAKSLFGRVGDVFGGVGHFLTAHPGLLIAVAAIGFVIWWHFGSKKIIESVVERFRTGSDNGG